LAPGVEMTIDLAVTEPVVPAAPMALAHLPTARSVDAAVVRSVNVVEEVRVTTTLDVALVLGLVSLSVTVDPLTALTEPLAPPNPPDPPRKEPPPGRVPDVSPGGLPPVRPPNPPPPLPAPAPPAPKPPVQVPEVGWVMETVVAVTGAPNAGAVDDEAVVGLPNAETHEPTVTAEADDGSVSAKVVADV